MPGISDNYGGSRLGHLRFPIAPKGIKVSALGRCPRSPSRSGRGSARAPSRPGMRRSPRCSSTRRRGSRRLPQRRRRPRRAAWPGRKPPRRGPSRRMGTWWRRYAGREPARWATTPRRCRRRGCPRPREGTAGRGRPSRAGCDTAARWNVEDGTANPCLAPRRRSRNISSRHQAAHRDDGTRMTCLVHVCGRAASQYGRSIVTDFSTSKVGFGLGQLLCCHCSI